MRDDLVRSLDDPREVADAEFTAFVQGDCERQPSGIAQRLGALSAVAQVLRARGAVADRLGAREV
jgi:hypothetical protein